MSILSKLSIFIRSYDELVLDNNLSCLDPDTVSLHYPPSCKFSFFTSVLLVSDICSHTHFVNEPNLVFKLTDFHHVSDHYPVISNDTTFKS